MKTFSFIVWQIKIPFYEIPVLGHSPFSIYKSTSPMSKNGMLVYGVGIGILTTVIRLFGSYPEGMSFAILIMNAFTPLINSYIKPKHFGGK